MMRVTATTIKVIFTQKTQKALALNKPAARPLLLVATNRRR
jgi:hypothetical protein